MAPVTVSGPVRVAVWFIDTSGHRGRLITWDHEMREKIERFQRHGCRTFTWAPCTSGGTPRGPVRVWDAAPVATTTTKGQS